jgi:hypothetical protein
MTFGIQEFGHGAASGAIALQYSDIRIERVNRLSHPAPQLVKSVRPAGLLQNGCFNRQREAVTSPASWQSLANAHR